MRTLQLAFYKGNATDMSDWKMKLAKKLMGDFIHIAIIFKEGSDYYASDAKYGHTISWTPCKEFSRNGYIMYPVPVSQQEYTIIKNYCRDAHNRQAGYNYKGQLLCLTPFADLGDGKEEVYTCPELIVHAFQKAKLMQDLVPAATTPHDILNLAQSYKNTVITATPNKKRYEGKLSTANVDLSYLTKKEPTKKIKEDNKYTEYVDQFTKFL